MSLDFYLATYFICSSLTTFLFLCSCGLSEPLKDRRKKERRKGIRHNGSDRRVSNEFYASSVEMEQIIPELSLR